MVGWQPRRNGTTNNKSSEIEKKKRRKKKLMVTIAVTLVWVEKKRPVKRVSRRWKMIRRFWIERVYERYHGGMEQLKPLLHLSFRLWFFRSMFWGNFHREWIRWNEAAHKTPNRRLRKKSLFLSLREDDVRDEDVPKKKLWSSNRKKNTQRATQTNTKQCRQRKRKKFQTQTQARELKHRRQKGRNGQTGHISTLCVRTQLSFLFMC